MCYCILLPHLGQNVVPGVIGVPQLGQLAAGGAVGGGAYAGAGGALGFLPRIAIRTTTMRTTAMSPITKI